MYKYINNFILSNFYDCLPRFFSRKFFKIFKIFFVETKLEILPENNHPSKLNYELQKEFIKKSTDKSFKPFISYVNLLDLLKNYEKKSIKINFYDFGACNIDLYLFLSKNLKKLNYIYYDQNHYNSVIEAIRKENNFNNLKVDVNFASEKNDLDFLYFGSSIQYLKNYKDILEHFFKFKPKHIIVSQTPFYSSDHNSKNIILKQINLHPIINFAYLLNYESFCAYMESNGYFLRKKNLNRVIKFLNFKNFNKKHKFVDFLDLVFDYNI
jgi:putative methyltransferase (TIGR04325 family)|tara:strand:- start:37 stop:840 length:804 start_codon:yes stop_codon:yes gene_type:complete